MKRFTRLLPKNKLDGTPYEWSEEHSLVYGKGGGDTTTVQKADPWGPQQQYLTDIFQKAQAQHNQGPDYYSNINPVAQFNRYTREGLDELANPNSMTRQVQNTMRSGLDTVNQSDGGKAYSNYTRAGGYGGDPTSGGTALLKAGVNMAQENTGENYLIPTAEVNAADRLRGILAGADDPTLQAYMDSSGQQITDQLIRNNLLPAQMDQLISGGYGGSSTQNVRRAAATDIADAIGRNNNKLILDQQGKQLDAANIVTGAQRDASNYGIDVFNSGVSGANVLANDAASSRSAAVARDRIGLDAAMAGDQLELERAKLGGLLAPLYDDLSYAGARRTLGSGQVHDARTQATIDAAIAKEMFNKGADNRALQEYSSLITGAGNLGGTNTTTAPGGGGSPIAGALGGGLAGLGTAGMLAAEGGLLSGATGAFASLGGPVGMGIVGISALLGSGLLG